MRLLALLMVFGCASPARPRANDDIAWLDLLDVRYESYAKPLELAAWQTAIGGTPADTTEAKRLEQAFAADARVTAGLATLATSADPQVRERARAWQRFRGRDRLATHPEVATLTAAVLAAADGDPPSGKLLGTLILDPDPAARERALAVIEQRTAAMIPHLTARARAMDALARGLGAPDATTFTEGGDALPRLEQTCKRLIATSAPAWQLVVARGQRVIGRAPTLADHGAIAVGWINEAGAFFQPRELRRLTEGAFAEMGFDVPAMQIYVVNNDATVGGSAFAISIPDDVRFQGNFTQPGYYAGRGYFHELGHAVHMKLVRARHYPMRMLPQDRALNEGIGEIFALVPTDRAWLAKTFPALTEAARADFLNSVRGFDAMSTRYNCLLARFELELHAGHDVAARWPAIYAETFGEPPTIGPTFVLLHPGYLRTPFYMRSYVYQVDVRDTFMRRLGSTPLVSKAAGTLLRETLLEPGNALTLDAYVK